MILNDIATRPGAGELLESQKDRQTKFVKGLLFGVGVVSGAAVGFHVASNGFDFSGPWSRAAPAGIAVLYLLAMLFGSVALLRLTDEVERFRDYKAMAFAGAVYVVVYPVWFLFWKGGFVGEPSLAPLHPILGQPRWRSDLLPLPLTHCFERHCSPTLPTERRSRRAERLNPINPQPTSILGNV